MGLVERETVLAQLGEWLAEARAGSGRVVLVGGEAGVGKTSLLRAFIASSGTRSRVLWGSCEPLVTPEPLGPFHDMRALRPVIGAHPQRAGLLEGLLDEFGASPTIMVLDDVHWADEATLDALRFLGRRLHDTTGLLVAAFREDDASASPTLRAVLGDLATAPGCRRLHVRTLSEAGVAALAAGHAVEPARLHAATGGNPFYVTEVLAAPGWTVPLTVRDAVLARVARLDPPSRAVIEAVSLAPGGLEPSLAADLSGTATADLDACLERGVLVMGTERVTFRHELARLAVEASIPASRRRRLHAELLVRLEAIAGTDASRLAHHADAAGDRAAVLRHAPAAARAASGRGAHRAAADHLRRAVDAAAPDPTQELVDLVSAWADERQRFDPADEVLELRERALDLRRRTGDRLGEAWELQEMSRLMEFLSDDEAGVRLLDEATAILEGLPPGPLLARARAMAAYFAYSHLRFGEALERADTAVELATTTGGIEATELALRVRGSVLNLLGTGAEGMGAYRQLRELAVARGDREAQMVATFDPAADLVHVRRYGEARRLINDAIEIGRAADLDARVTLAETELAWIAFEEGQWAEAEVIIHRVSAAAERHRLGTSDVLAIRGRIGVRRGTPGAAEELAAAWEIVALGPPPGQWSVAAGRAEAAWLSGRPGGIMDIASLGRLCDETRDAGLRWPTGELAFWLWRAGALDAVPRNAAEPYALQMAGDWRGAADAWERIGCPYEQAEALAEGDEPAMRRALAIFSRLGAGPAADRVRARMRRAGMVRIPARPQASTRAAPAELTRRQLEILALLVEGLTDREIAARLFITEKTAGHHVSAVLGKLGVRSRAEAASTARKLGIVTSPT